MQAKSGAIPAEACIAIASISPIKRSPPQAKIQKRSYSQSNTLLPKHIAMQSNNYQTIIAASPIQRLETMAQLTHTARRLSLLGQRSLHPDLQGQDWGRHIAKLWTGKSFTPGDNEMTWIQDSLGLAQQLHPIFEAVGIPYFVTGGVASSAWGEPRTTRDLDVIVMVSSDNRQVLGAALEQAGFLVAGLDSSTIQITHQTEITTADLIVSSGNTAWEKEQFKQRASLGGLWLASPEVLILSKLRWAGKSEKQQRDIIGILKASPVDIQYLRKWAKTLNLESLLEQILQAEA